MPRRAHIDAPGALQHIIIRGIERSNIFKDNIDRESFLDRLGAEKINDARTDQALAMDPDIIGVSCPFCTTMLEDGLKTHNMDDKVKVYDIAELLAQAVLQKKA